MWGTQCNDSPFPYSDHHIDMECWVWLTYSAIYSCIQHLSFVWTLIPNSTSLFSLLVLLIVTAQFDWFKKIIPHYWTEGVSYQFESWISYVDTLIWFYSNCFFNQIGKEESKIWCHKFLPELNVWNQSNDSIFLASNFQIFMTVYLHINYCFFHRAAWVIIWALLVRRVYNRVYGRFPPLLNNKIINHLNHLNHVNRLKLQFDQSLSTTSIVILLWIRPIHLNWSPSLPGSFAVLCVGDLHIPWPLEILVSIWESPFLYREHNETAPRFHMAITVWKWGFTHPLEIPISIWESLFP